MEVLVVKRSELRVWFWGFVVVWGVFFGLHPSQICFLTFRPVHKKCNFQDRSMPRSVPKLLWKPAGVVHPTSTSLDSEPEPLLLNSH